MTDTFTLIKELTEGVCIGHIDTVTDIIKKYLPKEFETEKVFGGVVAHLKKGKQKTLLIDAHTDQVGFTVTGVDERGFVSVANAGGIDLRCLPSRRVVIHGEEDIYGIFGSIPPHITGNSEQTFDDINDFHIDCGTQDIKGKISAGDFATFTGDTVRLSGNRISGKSLDDRAGCAVLLMLADRIANAEIPYNVSLLFSNQEELGLRGAKTAVFDIECEEAVSVDVSFGNIPGIPPEECKKLGSGAMIGTSPILSKEIFDSLSLCAKENSIPHTTEVMGRSTGTNADVISVTKAGIPTCLISIPLRNMHTDCEIIDMADIKAVCDLLYCYIMREGK